MKIQFCAAVAIFYMAIMAMQVYAMDDTRHYSVGDLEIMAIHDADTTMEASLLPELAKYPQFAAVFEHGPAPAVSQTFFFNNGDHKVLIDAGWGTEAKIKGHTTEILRKSGIKPEEITDILLTHMDHDHIGGLLENGNPVYPNATLWIAKPEYDAWINRTITGRPASSIDLASKVAQAYKVKNFNYGDEILPGIIPVNAAGHTPGHTAYDIKSGNDKMTVAGDIMHISQVQLAHPELSTVYDIDPAMAAAARERILQKAAEEKSLFGGMHFPMISDVRKVPDNGYVMKQPR